jgi:hypothetical protein
LGKRLYPTLDSAVDGYGMELCIEQIAGKEYVVIGGGIAAAVTLIAMF